MVVRVAKGGLGVMGVVWMEAMDAIDGVLRREEEVLVPDRARGDPSYVGGSENCRGDNCSNDTAGLISRLACRPSPSRDTWRPWIELAVDSLVTRGTFRRPSPSPDTFLSCASSPASSNFPPAA